MQYHMYLKGQILLQTIYVNCITNGRGLKPLFAALSYSEQIFERLNTIAEKISLIHCILVSIK